MNNTTPAQPRTSAKIKNKLFLYAELIRFEKPIGFYLLLWPTLWALAISSEGSPDGWILFVFVAGVFLMRSAGCAINDIADRDIDLHLVRTKQRPLTSGKISLKEAIWVFVILCLVAFVLVLSLNQFTIILSLGGVILAASYPFMKRFHYLPQVHLGAAFAWSIPMAFAAELNSLPKHAWLLYAAALLWTVAYDTIYAMVDRDEDLELGLKSTAILFGENDRLMIGVFQVLFLVAMVLLGMDLGFSLLYYLGLFIALLLIIFHQSVIVDRKIDKCFYAFLHNQWIGAVIFFGIMGHYYML